MIDMYWGERNTEANLGSRPRKFSFVRAKLEEPFGYTRGANLGIWCSKERLRLEIKIKIWESITHRSHDPFPSTPPSLYGLSGFPSGLSQVSPYSFTCLPMLSFPGTFSVMEPPTPRLKLLPLNLSIIPFHLNIKICSYPGEPKGMSRFGEGTLETGICKAGSDIDQPRNHC